MEYADMKKNIKMIVSYDGTRYFGWEHQPNTDMTIQGKLENVLNMMLKKDDGAAGAAGGKDSDAAVSGAKGSDAAAAGGKDAGVTVIGAGRTDAGVHARAMTANVILDTDMSCEEILSYMNRYLPEDISVNKVTEASPHFHSRYNAKGKTYRYTCWYDVTKPVFDRKYVSVLDRRPDIDKMKEAAQYIIGMHDFKCFCGNPKMKKSTVRVVDNIKIEESGGYIRFYFHGNGFLQNMVRIMTGTLLEVGFGKKKPEDIEKIIEGKDRQQAGFTAEAKGLTLMKVDYE